MIWKAISERPERPMPVLLFFANIFWTDQDGKQIRTIPEEPYRDDRIEVGFWTGDRWCENGTGHDVFEDWRHPDYTPTHWAPVSPPEQTGGEQ